MSSSVAGGMSRLGKGNVMKLQSTCSNVVRFQIKGEGSCGTTALPARPPPESSEAAGKPNGASFESWMAEISQVPRASCRSSVIFDETKRAAVKILRSCWRVVRGMCFWELVGVIMRVVGLFLQNHCGTAYNKIAEATSKGKTWV